MIACICSAVMLVLLFVDLITKAWAASGNVNQDFIGDFIRFDYYKNEGMAFGMLDDNPTAMKVVTAVTVFMIIGIAVAVFTMFKGNTPAQIALSVIESGAIGNLVDRLYFGYVRDFIDVSKLGFGICNIADFCVTGGAVALMFIILFIGKDALFPLGKYRKMAQEERAKEKEKEANAEKKEEQE